MLIEIIACIMSILIVGILIIFLVLYLKTVFTIAKLFRHKIAMTKNNFSMVYHNLIIYTTVLGIIIFFQPFVLNFEECDLGLLTLYLGTLCLMCYFVPFIIILIIIKLTAKKFDFDKQTAEFIVAEGVYKFQTTNLKRAIIKIFAIILLTITVYLEAVSVNAYMNSDKGGLLFNVIRNAAFLLSIASMVYFISSNKNGLKFLVLPCVLIIAGFLEVELDRLITFGPGITESAFWEGYHLAGVVSLILVVIDIKKGFRHLKFDYILLIIYWIMGIIDIIGLYFLDNDPLLLSQNLPYLFSPVILLALILWSNQANFANQG